MDRFAKTFFTFVIVALLALLLAYFMMNSALRSSARRKTEQELPQKSMPGSFWSSPRAYFCPWE